MKIKLGNVCKVLLVECLADGICYVFDKFILTVFSVYFIYAGLGFFYWIINPHGMNEFGKGGGNSHFSLC